MSFRANKKKRVRPNLSLKQHLCNPLARRALVTMGAISMVLMPVRMREAALTLMMRAKVKCILAAALTMCLTWKRSGEDWDELERKAAKCKAHLTSSGHEPELISTSADKKRTEGGRNKDDESDDSDRPKKKAPAKSKPHAKASANGKGKR
jgi:hypothetical protein